MSAKPEAAFDILTDLIEDPQNNGNYRLLITGNDLRRLWKATEKEKDQLSQWREKHSELEQANQILSEACAEALNERDKWREVARRLADNIRAHDIDSFGQNAEAFKGPALAAYDALAKSLSDGGKG